MATNNDNYAYTYDPTGKLPDNLIKNERHDVQPPSGIEDSSLFFLRAAPAFQESIVLRKGPTDTSPKLIEGVDYILTHKFLWKSYELTKPIFGSVTMINRNYSGEIYISYQTLGGAFVIDDQTYLERLARDIYRSRYVYWEQVSKNLPGLPPFDHTMSGTDTVGWDLVVDSILRLVAAIYDTANGTGGGGGGDGSASLNQHLTSTTAHKLANVGGSNLFNYAMASDSDFENEALNKYTNPAVIVLWVRRYITSLGLGSIVNDVSQLRLKANTIEDKANTLRDDVNAQKLLMDQLAVDFDKLKQRQDESETAVAEAVADLPVIKDDITAIKKQLNGEEPTGLGNRVGIVEAQSAQNTTDLIAVKEDIVDHENRLTNLEAGTGGAGGSSDLDQRVTVLEEARIINDDEVDSLLAFKLAQELGYNSNQLSFISRGPKTVVLKPNDVIQIELMTHGRISPNGVEGRTPDEAGNTFQMEVDVIYEDQSRKRIVTVQESLTEDTTGAVVNAKNVMSKTADVLLMERTVGANATTDAGVAGRVLAGVTFGRGAKAVDAANKGSGAGTYFKMQYKNAGVKDIKIKLNYRDVTTYINNETIPAGVSAGDLDALNAYLRGETGCLITVTKGA